MDCVRNNTNLDKCPVRDWKSRMTVLARTSNTAQLCSDSTQMSGVGCCVDSELQFHVSTVRIKPSLSIYFQLHQKLYFFLTYLKVVSRSFNLIKCVRWPPLWSSGQSSWLQIQRNGFNSRRYQIFWEEVGLERGPLSLASTIEKLLGRKRNGSGLESREYSSRDSSRWPCVTICKSWH
jgi:hypothetical protein